VKGLWGTAWLLGGKRTLRENHRTEVTEATEDELGLGVERSLVDVVAAVRETSVKGKASHRGHGGHRGGIGVLGLKGLGGHRGICPGNER
jgi:hypothetical protein